MIMIILLIIIVIDDSPLRGAAGCPGRASAPRSASAAPHH